MNPVNGPVLVVLLLAVVVLAALWRSEAMSARMWRERAEQLDKPIDLWPVSNVRVTDDWPPAGPEFQRVMRASKPPLHVADPFPPLSDLTYESAMAAARDRHPVGKGLRVVGGGGA